MFKLREAALVAAMVGSVSVFGAGLASAGGHEIPTVNCEQSADANNTVEQNGTGTNVEGGVSSGGDANASATQQICGLGNEGNENTAGDAIGGAGGEGGAVAG